MMEDSFVGSTNIEQTMNSPLVKRRSSHVRSVQKRVSFHQLTHNRHDELTNLLGHATSQNYLNNVDIRSNMRRYHSDIGLNQSTNSLAKYPTIAERGVPEGQEDPDSPKSDAQDLTFLIRKALFRRKSVQSTNKFVSAVEKRQYLDWARKKWNELQLIPILPLNQIKNLAIIGDDDVFYEIPPRKKEQVGQILVKELDLKENFKSFKCYANFYFGTPGQCQLVVSESTIYIVSYLDSIPAIVWKTNLVDLIDVKVKWNYSVLVLRIAVGEVTEYSLDFVDPGELQMAASFIDVNLRKIDKELVFVETSSQCQRNWQPSIRKWMELSLTDKFVFEIEYIGLLYFEESFFMHSQQTDVGPNKTGHLMFCWSNIRSWHPGYFIIKGGVLYQFSQPTDRVPVLKMSLSEEECKGYGRNYNSKRPHTIELQFRNEKSLLLAAASESEAAEWLTSLSQSSFIWDNISPSENNVPVGCGILVSHQQVFLFQSAQMDQPIASAPLDSISVIMINQAETLCLIELEYREASEGAGDWILYFLSENSLEEFLRATKRPREILSNASLSTLRNKSMLLKAI